jgi:hypothetical protein
MNLFTLSAKDTLSVETILKDFNIGLAEAKAKCSLHSIDYDAIIDEIISIIEDHPCATPLLSNNNAFVNNILSGRIALHRLQDDDFYDKVDTATRFSDALPPEMYTVLTGSLVILAFGEQAFNIVADDYGFSDPNQMYYAISAYLANLSKHHDHREITMNAVEHNGKVIQNIYNSNIHGDFRLTQYDCSSTCTVNPFDANEKLPFGFPKRVGSIAAYHSVEMSFLATILCYTQLESIAVDAVTNNTDFISRMAESEQLFGNFADAGMYTEGLSRAHFTHIDKQHFPIIPTELHGYYKASIDGGNLTFTLTSEDGTEHNDQFLITPDMVNELIEGLFIKVRNGNGRSCVSELKSGLDNFISAITSDIKAS